VKLGKMLEKATVAKFKALEGARKIAESRSEKSSRYPSPDSNPAPKSYGFCQGARSCEYNNKPEGLNG
jgi:hypothetical protein